MADEKGKNPQTKVEMSGYIANLATISMYLDKTGVEHHPRKVILDAEFERAINEFGALFDNEDEGK